MALCKKLLFNDVLKCSLGMTAGQARAFKKMRGMRQPFTVSQLAERIGRDRSAAQRLLAALTKKGLTERFQQNLDSGGYEFVYKTLPKKELKAVLRSGVKEFTGQVEKLINEF